MENVYPLATTNANKEEILNNIPYEMLLAELATRTATKVERFVAEQKEINAALRNQLEENKADLIKQSEKLYVNIQRNNSQEYVKRTILGDSQKPPISAQMITKLLIYAGIMQKNGNKPYINYTGGKEPLVHVVAINKQGTNFQYTEYRFHHERTWEIIRNRLNKDGLLMEYLNTKTKQERDAFIKRICPDDKKGN